MTKSKTTRRALFTSATAILLCVVMLVGTTFAWFTDTASTNVNKIQAGTLDILLEMKDAEGNWVDANGKTLDFAKAPESESKDIIWEPGCTYALPSVKLSNNGNLALKYKILISGATGDLELANVLDVYKDGVKTDYILADLLNNKSEDGVANGALGVGDSTDAITFSLHMQESAGNTYQGMAISGISVTVLATQDTVEFDSKDNQYDASAEFPLFVTQEDFDKALEGAEENDVIQLSDGEYTLPDSGTLPAGASIVGNGAENTVIVTGSNGYTVSNDNVTIKDVTVDGTAASAVGYGGGALTLKGDGATVENAVVKGGGTSTWGASVYVALTSGETAYIKNTTISGGFRGIFLGSSSGSLVVDGCEIDAVYPISFDGGGDFTLTVTNSKLHGWTSYGTITSASFTNTEFSKGSTGYDFIRPYADTTFTNCTFDADLTIGAGETGKTYAFNNCTKNGTAVTADNIQSLLLNMDSDGTNLRSCTIIVDGETVTLT